MRAAGENGIGTVMFRNALARRLGLTLTESLCLTVLGMRGVCSPTQLARVVGLTTGATTTMLDRLEKRGFIRRRPNPEDRRGVLVRIDKQYTERSRRLVAGIQAAHREVIARYTAEQLEIIADFLHRFAGNLELQSAALENENR